MENLVAIGVIIGLVNGIRLLQTDRKGFIYFLCALAAGMGFGYLGWFGITGLEAGLVTALASSGLYRVGEKVGGK